MSNKREISDKDLFKRVRVRKTDHTHHMGSSFDDEAEGILRGRCFTTRQIEQIRSGKKVEQTPEQLAERKFREKLYRGLDVVVGELELSDRVRQMLLQPTAIHRRINVLPMYFVGQIVQKNKQYFLDNYKGLGRKAAKEIEVAIAKHGATLGMNIREWDPPFRAGEVRRKRP